MESRSYFFTVNPDVDAKTPSNNISLGLKDNKFGLNANKGGGRFYQYARFH